MILPISQDVIIAHPAIKQIMNDYGLGNIQFSNGGKTVVFNQLDRYLAELKAEDIFQALNGFKDFCNKNKITSFSTIRIEGTSTLNSLVKVRAMFQYIFRDSDITVTIFGEQHGSDEECYVPPISNFVSV